MYFKNGLREYLITAGICGGGFGLFMCIYFVLVSGPVGILTGIVSGVLFGALFTGFCAVQSRQFEKSAEALREKAAEEKAIICQGAATQQKGAKGIVGWMFLTSGALEFYRRRVDFGVGDGKFTIFRDDIVGVEAKANRLMVRTENQVYTFAVSRAGLWKKALMGEDFAEEYRKSMEKEAAFLGKFSPKGDKKKLILAGGGGAAVLIILLVALVLLRQTPFEKARDCVLDITGTVESSDGYFTVDTNYMDIPSDKDASDYTREELVWKMANPDEQSEALEAIRKVNEILGFNDSLYSKMMKTTALMGRQEEETKKYRVSWTYHPDRGLEVTYEEK